MRFPKRLFAATLVFISFMGCQTVPKSKTGESTQESLDAVGQVTGALTGKELTDEEKRRMLRDLKNDKEAQSAVKSISGALEVKQAGIKYCPVDGQRFSAGVEDCPTHHVKLKELAD